MPSHGGHFVPAKRMALALNALIEGKHRQDSLHLIGFSDYARRMQPADLAAAGVERVYGTNMQHAFLLEDAPGLVAFAERLAQVTGGRVLRMSADEVGRTVVAGY